MAKASAVERLINLRLARIEKALGIATDEPLIEEPIRTREEMKGMAKAKEEPTPAEKKGKTKDKPAE